MPVHQGIKLTVVSQLELRIHPEFPHPESSQFTYRSPTLTGEEITSGLLPPSLSSDSKADKILGRPSTVSVYIPSQPGKYLSDPTSICLVAKLPQVLDSGFDMM